MTFRRKLLDVPMRALARHFGRSLSRSIFLEGLLDLNRCTRADVLRSVHTAATNHPGTPIYVLSDADLRTAGEATVLHTLEELKSIRPPCVLVLACNSDALALSAVRLIRGQAGAYYYGAMRDAPPARYFHRDDHARAALKDSVTAGLPGCDIADFENIAQALHTTRSVAGAYVEVGVYRGSSAFFALAYLDRSGIARNCYFLDTFTGFDYDDAAASQDRIWFNTHADTRYETVKSLLARFTTPHEVIRSNIITDPLPPGVGKIAVCNIDVDMYEAVGAALARVAPLVPECGIIIAEDQGHTPLLIGAYAAVSDFLASPAGRDFVPVELLSGQMFLVRTRPPGAGGAF